MASVDYIPDIMEIAGDLYQLNIVFIIIEFISLVARCANTKSDIYKILYVTLQEPAATSDRLYTMLFSWYCCFG